MAAIKSLFRNIVLCEDVRNEVGNKKSIMGAFSGDIIVAELPANIRVAFYIEFKPKEAGDYNLVLSVRNDKQQVAHFEFTASIKDLAGAGIIIPSGVLRVEKESDLALFASIDGSRSAEVLKRKVRIGEVQSR